MTVVSVEQALAGKLPAGGEVTVRGWVRTRRDSKAGLSFVNVSDGSCFAPIQVVATDALANYDSEVKHLSAGCSVITRSSRWAKACETGMASKAARASWMQTNRRNGMVWRSCI